MTDLVDDNKKKIISFHAQQERQEVDEQKVKFHYATKERQRKLNVGKSPDPEQVKERDQERYRRTLVLNMTKAELHKMSFPSAVIVNVYPTIDAFGNIIPRNDPRYLHTKPTRVTLQASGRHPFPLSRFSNSDLDTFVTNAFGKYIIAEMNPNKAVHDEHFKGLEDIAFNHNVLLEENEVTGRDDLNKRAFNVFGAKVYDHELNYINKKLEILGFSPIKKERALLRTQGNINLTPYNIFELGEV